MGKQKILQVITYAFIILWGYAGSVKLINWRTSQAEMHQQPFPEWMSDIFLWFIPMVELGIVVLLLIPHLRIWGY